MYEVKKEKHYQKSPELVRDFESMIITNFNYSYYKNVWAKNIWNCLDECVCIVTKNYQM